MTLYNDKTIQANNYGGSRGTNVSYATARQTRTAAGNNYVGQETGYNCLQQFYDIPMGATWPADYLFASARIQLYVNNLAFNQHFDVEARAIPTNVDWVAGDSLASYPLLGVRNTADMVAGTWFYVTAVESAEAADAIEAAIVAGTLRVLISSSKQRLGTAPLGTDHFFISYSGGYMPYVLFKFTFPGIGENIMQGHNPALDDGLSPWTQPGYGTANVQSLPVALEEEPNITKCLHVSVGAGGSNYELRSDHIPLPYGPLAKAEPYTISAYMYCPNMSNGSNYSWNTPFFGCYDNSDVLITENSATSKTFQGQTDWYRLWGSLSVPAGTKYIRVGTGFYGLPGNFYWTGWQLERGNTNSPYNNFVWGLCTLSINNGETTTNTRNVTLTISADANGGDPDEMCFSVDGSNWGVWIPYAETYSYTLTAQTVYPTEVKTVYVKFRKTVNGMTFESPNASDSIDLTYAWQCSILINDDAPETYMRGVHLDMVADDGRGGTANQMRLSNDGSTWSEWEPFVTRKLWELSPQTIFQRETKTVYLQVVGIGSGENPPPIEPPPPDEPPEATGDIFTVMGFTGAEIDDAIALAVAAGSGSWLYFPPGDYIYPGPRLVLPDGISMFGAGVGHTKLWFPITFGSDFEIGGINEWQGMTIGNTSQMGVEGSFMLADGAHDGKFYNVRFRGTAPVLWDLSDGVSYLSDDGDLWANPVAHTKCNFWGMRWRYSEFEFAQTLFDIAFDSRIGGGVVYGCDWIDNDFGVRNYNGIGGASRYHFRLRPLPAETAPDGPLPGGVLDPDFDMGDVQHGSGQAAGISGMFMNYNRFIGNPSQQAVEIKDYLRAWAMVTYDIADPNALTQEMLDAAGDEFSSKDWYMDGNWVGRTIVLDKCRQVVYMNNQENRGGSYTGLSARAAAHDAELYT